MPITYTFDPDAWLVAVRYTGRVSLADMREALQGIIDQGLFRKPLLQLGDIGGMEPTFKVDELYRHQDWRKGLPRFKKMAIVAHTDYEFAFARQFQMVTGAAGGVEFQVFRSADPARHWLGLR